MALTIPVACEGCEREGHRLRDCRIRMGRFNTYNERCPRELDLAQAEAVAEIPGVKALTTLPEPQKTLAGLYLEIPLNQIFWKEPIRKAVKEEDIQNIAMSFTCHGQIEPIVVTTPNEEGMYRGVVGRLRYEGMKYRKGPTILARVHPFKDESEIIEWQLAENLHRRDLTATERAEGYRQLYEETKKKTGSERGVISAITKSLEELTGEKQAARTVYEYMQVSELPQDVKDIIAPERNVGVKHGRELLRLRQDPEKQRELAQKTVDESWTVKQLKKRVDEIISPPEPKPSPIDTGLKFDCPVCEESYVIVHVDEGKHRFERITVMDSEH